MTLVVTARPFNDTIVVITPHPDDAEASCGGLIANYTDNGNIVIILTMTGGEWGIAGKSPDEARKIRTDEAIAGAGILHAKIAFFGAVDASLPVDTNTTEKLTRMLMGLHPSVVLAPWPMDVHSDHQATGMLAWRVFQDKRLSFSLYFYETINEPHTKSFSFIPTDYVDVSKQLEKKRDATMCHRSQRPENWYDMYVNLSIIRGYEADVPYAEAYLRAQNSSGMGGRGNAVGKVLER